jgi:hypothetical protein
MMSFDSFESSSLDLESIISRQELDRLRDRLQELGIPDVDTLILRSLDEFLKQTEVEARDHPTFGIYMNDFIARWAEHNDPEP